MNFLFSIFGLRTLILFIQNIYFKFRYRRIFHNSITIAGLPIVSLFPGSKIEVGTNLRMISSCYFSEPGINHPVVLRTMNKNAKIAIGNNVGISGSSICAFSFIQIGNDAMIGANVVITDNDFHPIEPRNRRFGKENLENKPIVIEDNVFIGMNSVILKGVRIGRNSVIGAGSIVTKNIPSDCIAAGNPAKVIRNFKQ